MAIYRRMSRNYRDLYRKISESVWFERHYKDKSLGDAFDAGDTVGEEYESD